MGNWHSPQSVLRRMKATVPQRCAGSSDRRRGDLRPSTAPIRGIRIAVSDPFLGGGDCASLELLRSSTRQVPESGMNLFVADAPEDPDEGWRYPSVVRPPADRSAAPSWRNATRSAKHSTFQGGHLETRIAHGQSEAVATGQIESGDEHWCSAAELPSAAEGNGHARRVPAVEPPASTAFWRWTGLGRCSESTAKSADEAIRDRSLHHRYGYHGTRIQRNAGIPATQGVARLDHHQSHPEGKKPPAKSALCSGISRPLSASASSLGHPTPMPRRHQVLMSLDGLRRRSLRTSKRWCSTIRDGDQPDGVADDVHGCRGNWDSSLPSLT